MGPLPFGCRFERHRIAGLRAQLVSLDCTYVVAGWKFHE